VVRVSCKTTGILAANSPMATSWLPESKGSRRLQGQRPHLVVRGHFNFAASGERTRTKFSCSERADPRSRSGRSISSSDDHDLIGGEGISLIGDSRRTPCALRAPDLQQIAHPPIPSGRGRSPVRPRTYFRITSSAAAIRDATSPAKLPTRCPPPRSTQRVRAADPAVIRIVIRLREHRQCARALRPG